MTTNNEQLLIEKINAGDTAAFAILVDNYKNLVFTLAVRMLKHKEEAEEVSQDAFIKIYKSLNNFKGDSKLSTWIYRVAYNSCLDRIKMNNRKMKEVAIDSYTEHHVKTLDDALTKLEKQERSQQIQDCLQQLPSEDAFLLTLFYFEELSLDEISEIVGIASNTVKVKLFRARKKLAVILKERLEPEMILHYGKTGR